MKLEEAIDRIGFSEMSPDVSCAWDVVYEYLESTRWRKLSEEKPSESGYYEIWNNGLPLNLYWDKNAEGFPKLGFTIPIRWRPIVGPEEG